MPQAEVLSPPPRRDAVATRAELPRYEVVGPADAPLIVALGGISANRHICSSDVDPSRGWWESIAGPRRALDTNRFRLLGFDFLDGGRLGTGFPERTVRTHDQADALAAILDRLDIDRVRALVGASYGGMVALAFAERHSDRLEHLVVIGAPHKPHPMTTALRVVQRRIVELGLGAGRPREALVLARALAVTTYRSSREFAARFDTAPVSVSDADAVFPVESYLRHHGERFASSWSAARFLSLSLSADLHEIDPSLITAATTIVAAEGDTNVPRDQLEELARLLAGPSWLVDLPSTKGHDAFLTEPAALTAILARALSS